MGFSLSYKRLSVKKVLLILFAMLAIPAICVALYQISFVNKKGSYHFDIYNEAEHSVIFAPISEEYPYPNVIWAGENKLPGYVKDPATGLEYAVVGVGYMSFNYGDFYANRRKDARPPVVKLPETIEFIDEAAFIYCSNIVSVTLPSSLKRIGQWAFYGDTALQSIYCLSPEPPQLGNAVFEAVYDNESDTYESYTDSCTLYVPAGSEEKYKNWGGYSWKSILTLPPL